MSHLESPVLVPLFHLQNFTFGMFARVYGAVGECVSIRLTSVVEVKVIS